MTEKDKQTEKKEKPEELAEQTKKIEETKETSREIKTEGATEKTEEKKKETLPKEKKKNAVPTKIKKYEAVAFGRSLPLSKKQCMYIGAFIKNKKIDDAINILSDVKKLKKAVPFKGEIPHRKEEGIMSGRYPVKAAGYFINLLKGLRGNVIVNGLELEKTRIYFASANWAARPRRSGGRRAKRVHVMLKAKIMEEAV